MKKLTPTQYKEKLSYYEHQLLLISNLLYEGKVVQAYEDIEELRGMLHNELKH